MVDSDLLFALDLASNEWKPLGGSAAFLAMAYQPHFDRVFAITAERSEAGHAASLVQMNANGAVLSQRPLIGNLPLECIGHARDLRLYAADKYLVLMFTPMESLVGPSYPDTFMYLIDPVEHTITLTMRKDLSTLIPGKKTEN